MVNVKRVAEVTPDGVVLSFEVEGCNNEYTLKNYFVNKFSNLEKQFIEDLIETFVSKLNNDSVKWKEGGFKWIINKDKQDVRLITKIFLKRLKELINKLEKENKNKGLAEWLIPEMKFEI